MRRVSTSRRHSKDFLTPMRSRSTERAVPSATLLEGGGGGGSSPVNGSTTTVVLSPKRAGHHRRCESDFLDSQQDFMASGTDDSSVDTSSQHTSTAATAVVLPQTALPTLPRYPVLEQHNKICWSVTAVDKFSVRGPAYFRDKKKVHSGPYLLEARGLDLFLLEKDQQQLSDTTRAEDLCHVKYVYQEIGGNVARGPSGILCSRLFK